MFLFYILKKKMLVWKFYFSVCNLPICKYILVRFQTLKRTNKYCCDYYILALDLKYSF